MGANLAAQDQEHHLAWPTEGREEGNTAATAASNSLEASFSYSAGMQQYMNTVLLMNSLHIIYVLPLMSQIMCSPFWPNESVHSIEYGQLVVTFVSTTPRPDWEMTVLQVADKNRVSSAGCLFHDCT